MNLSEHADIDALRAAFRGRLADVRAAAQRLGAFAFEPGESPPDSVPDDDAEALRDLVLRALARVSDPLNHGILRRLAQGDSSATELAQATGLGASALTERVSDLVQVGLVVRGHRGDLAGLTSGGRALVELVEAIVG